MPGEIKSTLELAMEKIAKLPRLTREEMREQRERELIPRAEAKAARFLSGELAAEEMAAEISRYEKENGEIIRKAFVEALFEPIAAGDAEKTVRAIEGLRGILDDDFAEQVIGRLEAVLGEYQRRRQHGTAEMEAQESERLRALGISGSAIRPNLQESELWRQREIELRQEFTPKLNEIKKDVIVQSHLTGV